MNYWILQANPSVYPGVSDYPSNIPDKYDYWCIRNHTTHVKIGDRFFIWRSGAQRGIYNIGEIISIEPHKLKAQKMIDSMWLSDVHNHNYEPDAQTRLARYPKILIEKEFEGDFRRYFSENELGRHGFSIRIGQGGIFYQDPDNGESIWRYIQQSINRGRG